MALSVVTFHHIVLTACAGPVNVATDTKVTWISKPGVRYLLKLNVLCLKSWLKGPELLVSSLVFDFSCEEISHSNSSMFF